MECNCGNTNSHFNNCIHLLNFGYNYFQVGKYQSPSTQLAAKSCVPPFLQHEALLMECLLNAVADGRRATSQPVRGK